MTAQPDAPLTRWPYIGLAIFFAVSVVFFWAPLGEWTAVSLDDSRYSHVILVPLISAFFLFRERRAIFANAAWSPIAGIPLLAGAVGVYWGAWRVHALPTSVFAMCLVWASGVLLCCGVQSLRAARFSLLLLLLMVPIPSDWMNWIIAVLQRASAEATNLLFQLMGTPMFRSGVTFELPGIGITVASECSSIHSSWALFITGLLVGHLALRSWWAKVFLSAATLPIAVFTNAIRITTLWLLGTRVNIGFLDGNLHHRGGALFSVISVAVLLLLLRGLREGERAVRTP